MIVALPGLFSYLFLVFHMNRRQTIHTKCEALLLFRKKKKKKKKKKKHEKIKISSAAVLILTLTGKVSLETNSGVQTIELGIQQSPPQGHKPRPA